MNGLTRREKLITDEAVIRNILEKAKVLHLGLVDGDEPYIVPMNYGHTFENGRLVIWLHGATSGRKYDIIRKNPKVFIEMECDLIPFEGEVACKYGLSYYSLMGKGIAEIVDDTEEKKHGLVLLMKAQTGKDDFTFDDKITKVVSVIRIDVAEYTAKHRPMPK